MTATKENARPVAATTGTGGGSTFLSSHELSHRDSITPETRRQEENQRPETKNNDTLIVKCNIDTVPMSRKPDGREYGAMRKRMSAKRLDARRLCERGILQGYSFTPAALSGTGGDSWREQRLFAVDIDNHAGDKSPLTVAESLEIMKREGVNPLFGYYTFSHTDDVPRFRIMFATDETVTDKADAQHITEALQSLFPNADGAAVDAARVFLGTDKGPCISYTGQTNPVSHLLDLYHERVEPQQTAISPARTVKPVSDSALARAIDEFDMCEYVTMSEGLQGKSRNGEMMFNPCPICGHKDDFYIRDNVWYCHSASNTTGIKGGNILNYLRARHGFTPEQAREHLMYDVLKWDREETEKRYREQRADKPNLAPFVPFEKPASETLPPFPVDALPPILRALCEEGAEFLQVSPGLIAPSLLATCALCLQGAVQIMGKPGHTETLSLYCATVERPGGNKTQAFELGVEPVREWQEAANKRRRAQINAWNTHLKKLQGELKNAENEMEQTGDETEVNAIKAELDEHADAEEREIYLLQGDCTPESLFDSIVDNRGCAGIFAGEPDLMTSATGSRYSSETNLSTLLDAYSGKGEIIKSRVTTGRKSIKNPHLTINFMAQPDAIANFLGNHSFMGRGLVSRFLISFPQSRVGTGRKYNTGLISEETRNLYAVRIHGLLDTWEAITREKDYSPVTLCLSPEAFEALCDLYADVDRRVNEDLYCIESFAAKYHGTVLRLAGILHCVKNAVVNDNAPEVSLETWREAERIGAYFTEHMKYAVSMSGASLSEAERDARYIWKRIRESGQMEISKRNIRRLCQRFKSVEEMNPGLNELVARGYIRVEKDDSGGRGRKSEIVFVNPEAMEYENQVSMTA